MREPAENGDAHCPLCALVAEFYEQIPKTPRNYWVMTELIFYLHGSDVCDYDPSAGVQSQNLFITGKVGGKIQGLPETEL